MVKNINFLINEDGEALLVIEAKHHNPPESCRIESDDIYILLDNGSEVFFCTVPEDVSTTISNNGSLLFGTLKNDEFIGLDTIEVIGD